MDIDARAFGQLEGEVKALREMLVDQNKVLADLRGSIGSLTNTMSEAKGGWKTVVLLGSLSAAIASALVWVIAHITLKG